VFSCLCQLVVYDDVLKAGLMELKGSNGEKAYCFFLSRVSWGTNFKLNMI